MGVVVPSSSIVGQLDGFGSHRVNVVSEGDWKGKILNAIFSFRSAGKAKEKASICFDDSKSGLDIGDWRKRMFWAKPWRHGLSVSILSQCEERFITVNDLLDNVLRRLRMQVFRPVVGFVLGLQSASIQFCLWRFKIKMIIYILAVIVHLLPTLIRLAKVVENCVIDLGCRETQIIQNWLCLVIRLNLGFVR